MPPEQENFYLIQVIKELLNLVEKKHGKDNKAIVASNIMYVVGQYPGFLKSHWRFLKTVAKKLNEFMHEKHPGVQDMACETYLVIAKECKEEFSKNQGEEMPYLGSIINQLQMEIKDLEPHQKRIVYESIGWMIKACQVPAERETYLHRLMDPENIEWNNILQAVQTQGIETLKNPNTVKEIDFFVRINMAVATSVGECYSSYLKKIYMPLLNVYKVYSQTISFQVQALGMGAASDNMTKTLKVLRKNILRLIEIFMKNAIDLNELANLFTPPLQELMSDYEQNVPDSRDPEVVLLFSTIIECLKDKLATGMEVILEKLGVCTLKMIANDCQSYPEHRLNYFLLIKNIVLYCFQCTSLYLLF
jgi:exportin-1